MDVTTPSAESQPSTAETAPAPQEAGTDLSWIGQDYHTDGRPDLGRFREHYENLLAEDARRRELPAAPQDGKYDLSIPAGLDLGDVKLPEGQAIELRADDPAYAPVFEELQAFMHRNGMTQETASGLIGLLAKYQATQSVQETNALAAEHEKLGPTPAAREARVNTLRRSLLNVLPEQEASELMGTVRSYSALRAIERLIARNTGPMAAPPQPQKQALAGLSGYELLRAARGM
jgi:hypothetical protein